MFPISNTSSLWKLVSPLLHPILPSTRKSRSNEDPLLPPSDDSSASLRDTEGEMPPKGCLAVYVGPEMQRFVIPMSYLSLPPFRCLMEMVREEFGFEQEGGLRIPCDVETFVEILRRLEGLELRGHKRPGTPAWSWS